MRTQKVAFLNYRDPPRFRSSLYTGGVSTPQVYDAFILLSLPRGCKEWQGRKEQGAASAGREGNRSRHIVKSCDAPYGPWHSV